jgi:hypothetical protein
LNCCSVFFYQISKQSKGLCTTKVVRISKPNGKNPYLTIFQELFILTGTTYAEGAFCTKSSILFERSFGTPVLLRVPSGKITAERLYFDIQPNPNVWLVWDLSINKN